MAKFVRVVAEKESHAKITKDEITTIWGDYFKQPQFEKFPEIHDLTHSIMMDASKCKQSINRENGINLLARRFIPFSLFMLCLHFEASIMIE